MWRRAVVHQRMLIAGWIIGEKRRAEVAVQQAAKIVDVLHDDGRS